MPHTKTRRRRTGAGIMGIRRYDLFLFGAVFALILGLSVFLLARPRQRLPDAQTPILAAQHFVKSRLGGAVILNFSPPDWTKVENEPANEIFDVTGTVEAVPKSGLTASSYLYHCVMHNDATRKSWDLVKLDLMRQ